MSEIMEQPVKILLSFDIKDQRPHKSVRLYTVNGIALGYGEMRVNEVPEKNDLFDSQPGYITYSATIDLAKLTTKNGKVVKEIKKIDADITSSDDPEEDEWVANSLRQLKEAKVTITLTTESELREDYRKMKHAKAKSGDNELPTEIVPSVPEVSAQTIEQRGEEVFKMVDADETPEFIPAETPPESYEEIFDYKPLQVFRGNNGKLYLTQSSKVSYEHEELVRKQGVHQLALDNLDKFHDRMEKRIDTAEQDKVANEILKSAEKTNSFNLDDFLKGI